MADSFQPEFLPLSQEQLDQITGGCGACVSDKKDVDSYQERAARYSLVAEGDHARGARLLSKATMEWAQEDAWEAKQAQARIDARQGTPGHPLVSGGPSISALPSK